jgi:1-acyl-sn-glycerol-3-phosphate acyltransferase
VSDVERPGAQRPTTPIVDEIAPWMAALAGAVRVGLAGLTRVRVEGAIDEIPRTGPVIVAANHSSNLDVPVLGSSLMPKLGRRLQWLGKKELFDWPVVGWIARNGGVHAIDRGAADVEAFRIATRILEEGHALFVFPEGTRSRDGTLGAGRDGVAVLALRTGAPIVPVGVSGSYERWPRGQRLPRPGGRVTVRIGSPFRLADVLPPDLDRRAAKTAATDLIMRRIAALLPERQRGAYGGAQAPVELPDVPSDEGTAGRRPSTAESGHSGADRNAQQVPTDR